MYITITAGHSNTDPGAVNGSDREADIAQDMRNIVASILRTDHGLEVKTDGEGKGNPRILIWPNPTSNSKPPTARLPSNPPT